MTILFEIAYYKRDEVAAAKAAVPPAEMAARAKAASPPRGFRAALLKAKEQGRIGLIAEIKKASPSKGLIRADFDPPAIARAYERGGAVCLSVLTDAPSFQGAPEFLTAARAATTLPAMRKDFLVDPYQVAEARALGADAVLVILAMADDALARALTDAAHEYGMDVLVETHNQNELERALNLDADMIGINNRDLHTFETRLDTTLALAPMVPKDKLVVAESGFSRRADLELMATAGVSSFLIGEGLMRQNDIAVATAKLTGTELAP
jgi:indole-3-glycerol phosphate synthase